MKRSDYRPVVKDLADVLKMNWACGVEFVEMIRKCWVGVSLVFENPLQENNLIVSVLDLVLDTLRRSCRGQDLCGGG